MQSGLFSLIDKFQNQKVIVLGDLIADEFVHCRIARVSREAPVLILRHEETKILPGGAANTAANIAELGAEVILIGVVGNDQAGSNLIHNLNNKQINTKGIIVAPDILTTTKMRILAASTHASRQQVVRVDYEENKVISEYLQLKLLDNLQTALSDATAIILSDYNYGVVSYKIVEQLRAWKRSSSVPIVVDSRFKLQDLYGFTTATPNEVEAEELCGCKFESLEQVLLKSEEIRNKLHLDSLVLTRGEQGMVLAQKGKTPVAVDAVGNKNPVDVTGAGDTVIAVYSTAIAAGANFEEAMNLANYAASLVVMKQGTATITREELFEVINKYLS